MVSCELISWGSFTLSTPSTGQNTWDSYLKRSLDLNRPYSLWLLKMVNWSGFRNLKHAGPKEDDKAARQFICDMYLAQNPDPDRMCYSHFTVATGQDLDKIKWVVVLILKILFFVILLLSWSESFLVMRTCVTEVVSWSAFSSNFQLVYFPIFKD